MSHQCRGTSTRRRLRKLVWVEPPVGGRTLSGFTSGSFACVHDSLEPGGPGELE